MRCSNNQHGASGPELPEKMEKTAMKYRKLVTLCSAAVLAAGMLTPAFAQRYAYGDRDWNQSDSGYGHGGGAAARWDRFMDKDQNREFARIFRGNPNIIHDPNYMEQWTGVRDLFRNDPEVRDYAEQTARNYDRNTRPAEKWNRLLEANPNFAERYRQNPSIVNDSNMANDEPEIREFMRTNPDVRPFLERQAGRSGGYGGSNYDRDEDLRSDSGLENYMASHPNIARKLRDNPSLVNDQQFVRNHPNLHEYLRNHPEARY
jgi:hypothetical protein